MVNELSISKKPIFEIYFYRIIFLFYISLAFSSISVANDEVITHQAKAEQMMNRAYQPTVKEYRGAFGGVPIHNPFHLDKFHSADVSLPSSFEEDFSTFIANMENLFPHYILAPMGRDARFIGVAVEAFYESIHISDRVSYINLSSGSFDSLTYNLANKMLTQAGLHGDTSQKGPLILIDRTPYKNNHNHVSQSRKLMQHAVNLLRNKNVSRTRQGDYLQLISTSFPEEIDSKQTTSLGSTTFRATLTQRLDGYNMPSQPIGCKLMANYTDLSPLFHGSFGGVITEGDGRVTGSISGTNPETQKWLNLRLTHKIISLASSKKFRALVRQKAQNLGYRFPHGKIADYDLDSNNPKQPEPLEEIITRMQPAGDQGSLLTTNGAEFKKWFLIKMAHSIERNKLNKHKNSTATTIRKFIKTLFSAHKDNDKTSVISSRDVRRLIGFVLGEMEDHPDHYQAVADGILHRKYSIDKWQRKKNSIIKRKNHPTINLEARYLQVNRIINTICNRSFFKEIL